MGMQWDILQYFLIINTMEYHMSMIKVLDFKYSKRDQGSQWIDFIN